MARVDLTVRGGGIFGLSIAWAAVRRGALVRVIERDRIGAGASGGIVGAMSPHVPENWNEKKAFQLESLLMAEDWWRAVAESSCLNPGYARTGRLQPLPDDAAITLAQSRADNAAILWQGRAQWQVVRAAGQGWEPASPTSLLVHDTLSARIHPLRALSALVAAIRASGGEVILGDAPDEGPVIWATGIAGLNDLTVALGRTAGDGVKGQAALLRHQASGQPQLFIDAIHIIPHDDGTVAIGSTSAHQWNDPTATDADLDTLIARARAALPALATAPVLQRWSALRPRTPTRSPILGEWPDRPGHFIANGGFKIGFGMAPKVAEVMADLVLDRRDTIPPGFNVAAL